MEDVKQPEHHHVFLLKIGYNAPVVVCGIFYIGFVAANFQFNAHVSVPIGIFCILQNPLKTMEAHLIASICHMQDTEPYLWTIHSLTQLASYKIDQ